MKVLIIGAYGQLGQELSRAAWADSTELVARDRDTLDIATAGVAESVVTQLRPDVVINAAAYTAVDRAESEREQAFASNTVAPSYLARACAKFNTPLVHVSTDYVFDGSKAGAYHEGDLAVPLGVYGSSKREGELAIQATLKEHVILRTAWLYSPFGNNFVKTMLRLGKERSELRVVADQYGCPTSAADLASWIVQLIPALSTGEKYGIYHAVNDGVTNWYGFAQAVLKDAERRGGKAVTVTPIFTADYPTPARRPANSVLETTRLREAFGVSIRAWREALQDVLDELHDRDGGGA